MIIHQQQLSPKICQFAGVMLFRLDLIKTHIQGMANLFEIMVGKEIVKIDKKTKW